MGRGVMPIVGLDNVPTCDTSAGFQFVVTGGWHSAFSGVLASIVFVAIVFVLTNDPRSAEHQADRGPALQVLFVTFFVFLVASFLWATLAGFPTTSTDAASGTTVPVAVQSVLAVPSAWLLGAGATMLFFAINWLVAAYAEDGDLSSGVSATAIRCFRLIAWLTAVEVWIAIETASRALAGEGWWYTPAGVLVAAVVAVPFIFADKISTRLGRPDGDAQHNGALRIGLGVIGTVAVVMVGFFAVTTGQPEATILQEGNWCGQGLPGWAGLIALAVMASFLVSIAALARALPRRVEATS